MTDVSRVLHIALVEDDPDVRPLLTMHLQRDGSTVDAFENGDAFIDGADLGAYDVVVTDLMMPAGTGLDVIEHVRTFAPWLPVAILTAVPPAVVDVPEGVPVLVKPIADDVLMAQLRRLARVD